MFDLALRLAFDWPLAEGQLAAGGSGIRGAGSVIRIWHVTQSVTKRIVVTIDRRERTSERWQALGVGPQRKVRR